MKPDLFKSYLIILQHHITDSESRILELVLKEYFGLIVLFIFEYIFKNI